MRLRGGEGHAVLHCVWLTCHGKLSGEQPAALRERRGGYVSNKDDQADAVHAS